MSRTIVKTRVVAFKTAAIVHCDDAGPEPMYFVRGLKPPSHSDGYLSFSNDSAKGHQGIRKDSQKLFVVREPISSAENRFFWDVPCFTTLKEAESFLNFVESWYALCGHASSPDSKDISF